MPYRFRRRETVITGVRRIAREQIARALAAIQDDARDPHETVHQVRQRCKRIRGLLRLVRPQLGDTYRKENAYFRDAASRLSHVRDTQSMVECYGRLLAYFRHEIKRRQFASIGDELTQRRNRIAHQERDVRRRLKQFRKRMRGVTSRIDAWSLADDEFPALAEGFEQTYRRAQQALERAYATPSAENFHEWRKCVKYHGHHTRLLRGVWPSVMDAYWDAADCLGGLLGDDHDLAMVRRAVLDEADCFGKPAAVEAFVELIDRRRCQLQREAQPVGLRLFAHDPAAVTQWFADCWSIWRTGEPQTSQSVRFPLALAR